MSSEPAKVASDGTAADFPGTDSPATDSAATVQIPPGDTVSVVEPAGRVDPPDLLQLLDDATEGEALLRGLLNMC